MIYNLKIGYVLYKLKLLESEETFAETKPKYSATCQFQSKPKSKSKFKNRNPIKILYV